MGTHLVPIRLRVMISALTPVDALIRDAVQDASAHIFLEVSLVNPPNFCHRGVASDFDHDSRIYLTLIQFTDDH